MTSKGNRGERRRRKAEQRRENAEQRRRLGTMSEQAAGLWEIDIIRIGGPSQHWHRTAILGWLAYLGKRPCCMLCECEFSWGALPEGFVFIRPHRPDLTAGFLSITGLCAPHTALDDAALRDACVSTLRDSVLPGARVIDPANLVPGGRA